MSKNNTIEKWYLDEIKKRAERDRLQRLGLNDRFFGRKKKAHFSILRFIQYYFVMVRK